MKKHLIWIASLALAAGLAGCAEEGMDEAELEIEEEPIAETQAGTAIEQQPVVLPDADPATEVEMPAEEETSIVVPDDDAGTVLEEDAS